MTAEKTETLRQAAIAHARMQHQTLADAAGHGEALDRAYISFMDQVEAYLSTVPEDERGLYWEFLALQLHENALVQHRQSHVEVQRAVAQATRRARRFMLWLCAVVVALALTALLQMC